MYPVINASCIFIDDFPSPQYENTSDVTKKEYNRTVKEFYRDIWWPDMQKVANRYGGYFGARSRSPAWWPLASAIERVGTPL